MTWLQPTFPFRNRVELFHHTTELLRFTPRLTQSQTTMWETLPSLLKTTVRSSSENKWICKDWTAETVWWEENPNPEFQVQQTSQLKRKKKQQHRAEFSLPWSPAAQAGLGEVEWGIGRETVEFNTLFLPPLVFPLAPSVACSERGAEYNKIQSAWLETILKTNKQNNTAACTHKRIWRDAWLKAWRVLSRG